MSPSHQDSPWWVAAGPLMRVVPPTAVACGEDAGTATVFALPSLEEGFGLPLLEAMRRGVPVACSNISSLPEVVGPAAELFDPYDVDDMRAAIARVLGDPALAERLVRDGYERIRVYTWEATARATLESYRRAIAARRVSRPLRSSISSVSGRVAARSSASTSERRNGEASAHRSQ